MSAPYHHKALPAGTILREWRLEEVLGVGGFGIVYRAWDDALQRDVALKEYMPVSLAGRGSGQRVTLRTSAHDQETLAVRVLRGLYRPLLGFAVRNKFLTLAAAATLLALAALASPALASGCSADFSPITIQPGHSAEVSVTFTPTGAKGTKVRGNLYVDTLSDKIPPYNQESGSEVTAIPYKYTIGRKKK